MMGCINPGRETPWQVELGFLRAGSHDLSSRIAAQITELVCDF
jgi:hypothetical protein